MAKKNNFDINRRYLAVALILLLALYVLLPQIGEFKSSLTLLTHPQLGWTCLALLFTLLTYVAGAATYKLLAFKTLDYAKTVFVQFAAMFVNRLMPAGIGAASVNYLYLKKQKHSVSQAATVVAVNNILGGLGHNILLGLTLLLTGYSAISGSGPGSSFGDNLKYVWVALGVICILALVFGWQRFKKNLVDVKNQLFDYRHRPSHLIGALGTSMVLTSFNVLALFASANALGVELSLGVIMLVFTLGIGAGTATPTPGGLGGFEAGLVAGFVSFNIDSSTALAVALLYRLISYWLTLAVGAAAFVVAEKKQYF